MSDQNWTPGRLDIDTPIVISPDTEQDFGSYEGGGYGNFIPPTYFRMTANIAKNSMSVRSNIEGDYRSKLNSLPGQLQSELSSNGATITASSTPTDLAAIERDKFIVDKMIQLKTAGLQSSSIEANSFYGSDPHNKSQRDYIETFDSYMRRQRSAGIKTQKHWIKSYTAGYSARLYAESIRLLTQHSNQLDAAYAEALAREETARQAEAQAREIAERNAQNVNLATVSGAAANAKPLVLTPDGLIAGYENLPVSLGGALDALEKAAAALGRGPLATLFATVFYSPGLGNGELQRNPVVLTMPLSLLASSDDDYADLHTSDSASVPFRVTSTTRGEHTQLYLSPTGEALSDRVRVREARLDPSTHLYTFRTEGLHPRTLTWTPDSAPGNEALGSTELPVDRQDIKIYPGARVTPVEGRTDEHPACDEADTDDYILWFPKESGIEPVYVMASRSGPRYEPGTATGIGKPVGENWLGSASTSGGAPIPSQIADQLRGQDFRNFDKFREKFWSTVAADPVLSRQFSKADLKLLLGGAAPTVDDVDFAGKRDKFEIHHISPIKKGGAVYDIDNLAIMTPKAHVELHKNGNKP